FSFTVRELFERPTVAALAELGRAAIEVEPRPTGSVALTPIQRWFFGRNLPAPHHFNQAVAIQTRELLDERALDEAVAVISEHHDALRLRFTRDTAGAIVQSYAEDAGVSVTHLDLSELEPTARTATLTRRSSELQASLDLERGPLLRVLHA